MRVTDTHVYFWGSVYSQWYQFKSKDIQFYDSNGVGYNCCEQYMMAQKALLFNDIEVYHEIMDAVLPKDQKDLGKKVKGFDKEVWDQNCIEIVTQGNIYKFSQVSHCKKTMMKHKDKTFVEGSPVYRIWGVGLKYDNDLILDESNWKGTNYLGIALNEACNYIVNGLTGQVYVEPKV